MPADASTRDPTPRRALRISFRLLIALVAGVVAALFAPALGSPAPVSRALVGFIVASLAFCVPLMWVVMRLDAEDTVAYVDGMDPTRSETDIIVVFASLASLAGIGAMLLGGGQKSSGAATLEALVTIATVACGWLLIHTIYTVRYARHWFGLQQGCVDFDTDHPRFSDFAYLSFTLGMTYQVSDTQLKTSEVRKIVLHHTLLSYVFGTVIVAATINLVVGLAK
jgi:uncharacterized membrane protein